MRRKPRGQVLTISDLRRGRFSLSRSLQSRGPARSVQGLFGASDFHWELALRLALTDSGGRLEGIHVYGLRWFNHQDLRWCQGLNASFAALMWCAHGLDRRKGLLEGSMSASSSNFLAFTVPSAPGTSQITSHVHYIRDLSKHFKR